MAFVIFAANTVWERRQPSSKKWSARTFGCSHGPVRKDVCVPGVKSGLCLSGVIGPITEEILFLLQVSRKEIKD